MALTDTAIRLARLRERAYKLSDGRGLCLLVQPNGSKWWRYRYRFEGVSKMLSMGIYPDVPLSEARERRDAARRQLAIGVNPSTQRKTEKAEPTNIHLNRSRGTGSPSKPDTSISERDPSARTKKRSGCSR